MESETTSTLEFVKLFSAGVKNIIERSTGKNVHVSRTAMKVSGVQVAGRIGAFVAFNGDYNGIMILNFEGDAALEIVGDSLLNMGLQEEDVPKHVGSDEVRQNIGELTNQCVGKCRSMVEEKYDLSSFANIPAVVPITVSISLTMVSKEPANLECVRVCFTTEKRNKFYMELALEPFTEMNLES